MSQENSSDPINPILGSEPGQLSPEEKAVADLNLSAKKMFSDIQTGKETRQVALVKLSRLVRAPEFARLLSAEQKVSIIKDLQEKLKIKEEQEFVRQIIECMQPLVKIKNTNPELFEDMQARISMETGGFIPLNSRVSYGLDEDYAHFHLAPSYLVKEKLPALFIDAMQKLAEIIKKHPEITKVNGTSALVATKTYGTQLKKIGFDIVDISPEEKAKYFGPNEKRDIKRAIMERQKFLQTFSPPEKTR